MEIEPFIMHSSILFVGLHSFSLRFDATNNYACGVMSMQRQVDFVVFNYIVFESRELFNYTD